MQTKNQIQNKITDLEFWLKHNPNHPNRVTIASDLRYLKSELLKKETNEF